MFLGTNHPKGTRGHFPGAILSGGNYLWGNFPGAIIQRTISGGQFSSAQFSLGAIILVGNCPGTIIRGGGGAIIQGAIVRKIAPWIIAPWIIAQEGQLSGGQLSGHHKKAAYTHFFCMKV